VTTATLILPRAHSCAVSVIDHAKGDTAVRGLRDARDLMLGSNTSPGEVTAVLNVLIPFKDWRASVRMFGAIVPSQLN